MKDAPDGQRIGRYYIVEPIPGGGMGQVFKAWDPDLRREVALKIVREESEDPGRQRRLLEEAQAVGALNHPNILAVYDVGLDQGRLFIVSEFIRGNDLSVDVARGVFPLKRLLDCAVQIAAGLRAAHDAGIAHRDQFLHHDQISRESFMNVGAGAALSLTDSTDLFFGYTRTVTGRNTHATDRGLSLGLSWSFGRRGGDDALASRDSREGSLVRCVCEKKAGA
jgi:protein kinase-like protein